MLGYATDTLSDTGAVAVAGGTLDLGTNSDTVGAFTLSSGSLTGTGTLSASSFGFSGDADLTVSTPLGGSGNLTKTGSGTLTLASNNTYTGRTIINSGTLAISSDANLGSVPGSAVENQLTLNNGTLATFGNFTLASKRGIKINASGGTITPDANTTLNYAGTITAVGPLRKSGAGTLDLSSATYNGGGGNGTTGGSAFGAYKNGAVGGSGRSF